jgi:hypothetical protein
VGDRLISGETFGCSLVPSVAAAFNSLSRAPQRKAKLAQVIFSEITKHVRIDRIVAKRLRVLLQTDPTKPTVDVQVLPFRPSSVVVSEKIDTSATAMIPRGFLNQLGFRHVDADYSTAA